MKLQNMKIQVSTNEKTKIGNLEEEKIYISISQSYTMKHKHENKIVPKAWNTE